MNRLPLLLGAWELFVASCVSTPHDADIRSHTKPQTTLAYAVDLIRAIYDPTKTGARITITETRLGSNLQKRLDQIRAEHRNLHVAISVLDRSGEEISQRYGTYVQGSGEFVASAKDHEYSSRFATIRINFLDWGNDRLIVGFTDTNSQPLSSENFEYHSPTSTWDLFESGLHDID